MFKAVARAKNILSVWSTIWYANLDIYIKFNTLIYSYEVQDLGNHHDEALDWDSVVFTLGGTFLRYDRSYAFSAAI